MTDKALEAVARVIARDLGGENYAADDWGVFASTAEKAISAHISALPGEAEVVAFMHPTSNWAHVQYSEIDMHCPKDGPRPTPLVTLASLQAMQARAEKAEEAANEAKDAFWAIYPKYFEMLGAPVSTETARTDLAARAEAAEARVKELEEALREIRDGRDKDGMKSDFPAEIARTALKGGSNG